MATGTLGYPIRWVILKDGVIAPGAKLITAASGTDTPQAVYSNQSLTTPLSNPVVADADGVLPVFFLGPNAYRFTVTDANDATIYAAQDNITGSAFGNTTIDGTLSVSGLITATSGIATNTITERTAASGVTIDSVLLKDSTITTAAGSFSVLEQTATGDAEKISNANVTPGSGTYGSGIAWSMFGSATRRRAGIAPFQATSDPDQMGLAFFVHQSTSASADLVEIMRLFQNLKLGGTANRGTTESVNGVVIFDGTAPVGTLTNGITFYSASGEARVMDAAGNSTLLSPHDHESKEWIYHSVDSTTGKVLRIDVERMFRVLNDQLGGGFIEEYIETDPERFVSTARKNDETPPKK